MAHIYLVYDKKADCQSRVRPDFDRVLNVDEDGNEHIIFELTDYKKIQESLGSWKMWTLQALMSAGIDPKFGIKTGLNTRLEGYGAVESAVAAISGSIEVDSNKSE